MLLTLKFKLVAGLAAIATPMAVTTVTGPRALPDGIVAVTTSQISYRMAGDFNRDGRPTAAPLRQVRFAEPLRIMRQQVTAGEYARCVAARACPPPATSQSTSNLPVVGVNFQDATAYAEWISARTGVLHRLPTDEEWVRAAAERAPDETPPLVDPADPAQAWIARYEEEADRARSSDAAVRPVGSFGVNSNGLTDLAGNVWEWTSSCFIRASLEPGGSAAMTNRNCGVRVIEGAHRAYLTDFIRDPRSGGCAFGTPPANIGFRLVVDSRPAALPRLVATRIAARLGFGG